MAKITYTDKVNGSSILPSEMNQIKSTVNTNDDTLSGVITDLTNKQDKNSSAQPIWIADYNSPTAQADLTPPWQETNVPSSAAGQPPIPARISIVDSSTLPDGKWKVKGNMLKTTLLNGEVLIDGGSARAEVSGRHLEPWDQPFNLWPDPAGSERWYSYSLFIPSDFDTATDTKWTVITQLKGFRGGQPPITVGIRRSTLVFGGSVMADGKIPDVTVPFTKGTWNRIVFGVKLSNLTDGGWFEGWINGVNVVPRVVTRTMDSYLGNPDPIYLKQGIYRDPTFVGNQTLYFSPTKIGESYASVVGLDTYFNSGDVAALTQNIGGLTDTKVASALDNSGLLFSNKEWNPTNGDNPKAPLKGGRNKVKKNVGQRALITMRTVSDMLTTTGLTNATTTDSPYGTTALQLNFNNTTVTTYNLTNSAAFAPLDVRNGILRLWHKPIQFMLNGSTPRLDRFTIELHSAGTPAAPTANYHSLKIGEAPFEFSGKLTASEGTGRWQTYGVPVNNLFITGTGADLSKIIFARVVFRATLLTDKPVILQLGNLDFIPNPLDKAKCILSFDDGFKSHLSIAAAAMSKYGFRGIAFPSPISQLGVTADKMTAQDIRTLHDIHGWQIGSQAWTSEDQTYVDNLGEDGFTADLSKLRNWQASLGVTGGEHGSYFSNVTAKDLIAYPTFRKHFRSMRRFDVGASTLPPMSIGESFPFGDPMNIKAMNGASAFSGAYAQYLTAHVDQAITNKGVAYFVWHDDLVNSPAAKTGFDALLAYLHANRDKIDVVTEEELYESYSSATTASSSDPADCIYITGGGQGPSGDDTAQFQAKIDLAILYNKKLIIPAPDEGKYYRITSTLNVMPYGTKQECYLDIEGHGVPRYQIRYDGAPGTACIRTIAHRYAVWSGVKIALENKVGLIAFDIDTLDPGANNTPPSRGSNTHNTYINCQVAMGNLADQNQKGWRIGYESGGGGDISDLSWINCSVYGRGGAGAQDANDNDYGWHIYGGNTLQNTWTNAFGAFLGKMYSNIADVPNKTGNGASYFFGTGTSQNKIDFEIGNSQSYLISGGRFESGKQVLKVGASNISPAITFQNVQIDDYEGVSNHGGGTGNLFFLDMPGSLSLDNVSIKAGRWPSYTASMIKGFGSGGESLIGRILVRGGSIQASTPTFWTVSTDPTYVIDVKTVARITAAGVPTSMFADVGGSASAGGPDVTVDKQLYLKEAQYIADTQEKKAGYNSFKGYFARTLGYQPVDGKEVLFSFVKSNATTPTYYFPAGSGDLITSQEADNLYLTKARSKVGTQDINSQGTNKVFTIAHQLGNRPDSVNLCFFLPTHRNGDYTVTLDETNITITYVTTPPSGWCRVDWQAYRN